MKNKQKLFAAFERCVFTVKQLIQKDLPLKVDFDLDKEIKREMALKLAELIIKEKSAFIVKIPLDKLNDHHNISEFLQLTMRQETEYSLELVILTREEFRQYGRACISAMPYKEIKEIKKEMKQWDH
jgi:hypothetical protein